MEINSADLRRTTCCVVTAAFFTLDGCTVEANAFKESLEAHEDPKSLDGCKDDVNAFSASLEANKDPKSFDSCKVDAKQIEAAQRANSDFGEAGHQLAQVRLAPLCWA